MASLMATLGLNNSSFLSKLQESRGEAAKGGAALQKALNPEGGVGAGAMREGLVLLREIGRGNWNRIPGSLSILLGQLKLLPLLLNPITAVFAGIIAGAVAAYKLTSFLVDKLKTLKMPDVNPEHIAKHLQKINQAAEAQKDINNEVRQTVELYDSAAKSAERFTGTIKELFNHQRKMNEYALEKELKLAESEEQRAAIRKKHADAELALNARERQEEVANKMKERMDLDDSSAKKKQQGDAIAVNSKEHDKQIVDQRKKAGDEAQKYLDDLSNKSLTDKAKEKLMRGYNSVALSGVSGNDLDKADADNKAEAHRRIMAAREAVDMEANNDELRARKSQLYKDAASEAGKAAELGKSIPDIVKANAQKNRDEASESKAKQDAENVKEARSRSGARADVNSLQRIGAFAGGADPKDNLMRQGNRSLQRIETYTKTLAQKNGVNFE
jgi:hypothetical protein